MELAVTQRHGSNGVRYICRARGRASGGTASSRWCRRGRGSRHSPAWGSGAGGSPGTGPSRRWRGPCTRRPHSAGRGAGLSRSADAPSARGRTSPSARTLRTKVRKLTGHFNMETFAADPFTCWRLDGLTRGHQCVIMMVPTQLFLTFNP